MSDTHSLLRLNVGFIVHQGIGYYRDFDFNLPQVTIEPDLSLTALTGVVRVSRTPQGLLLEAKLQANTPAECVRCLEMFTLPLQTDFSELYAFDKRSVTDSGLILPENGYINLAPLLRDFMILEIPIRPLCQPDCKGLCPECGTNLNLSSCEHLLSNGSGHFDSLQSLP